MREDSVSVMNGPVRLAGTLVWPDEVPRGVVIFVPGSGAVDRNENTPRQRLDVFNRLAEALAQAGYASIRYDKRGCGASKGSYLTHGYDDLVADLLAWVSSARARPELGAVWLCGHSEGTILAQKAAAAEPERVAGLVLICPFLTPGREILARQAEEGARMVATMPGFGGRLARAVTGLFGGVKAMQARLIARVMATDAPVLRRFGRRQGVRWLRDFLTWDFAAIHMAVALPTLLLVAEKDVQCPPEDGARIASLNPKAEVGELPGITHILRHSDLPAGFADYRAQLARPIDRAVGAAIVDWLAGQAA